jgi:hypothetical protein
MKVKMKKAFFFVLVLVAFLNIPVLSAQRYSLFEAVNLIEKEYQENKLSLDQRCLYLIYGLRNYDNLPQRFKIFKEEELKCGTPLIIEVKRNWDKLSQETKEEINQLLMRPPKPFTYRTTNFVIHYDTAGAYPVYHHWEDVDPADGVPDYVNRVGEYMERSWYVEIDSMGYYAPPFDGTEGGDSLYDVYIDVPLGYAAPEDPSSQYPDRPYAMTSYIDIGNDLRISRYPDDPLPFCKATCSHELFHACQFVFTGQIWYPEDYTSWLYESCSNWIEESVWDELNDVYYYLNSYLPVSYQSLYHESGRHMYASWIWNQYLSENFGRDILHSIWLKHMETFACAAVDSVLARDFGTTMNDQFQEFAVWNWFTNGRDDGNHYSEGAFFFPQDTVVYVATHSSYPASGTIGAASAAESYGANYILFETSTADTGTYQLTFSGDSQFVYGVNLILYDPSGSTYLKMDLDGSPSGELLIPDFSSYDKVIMVVTHLFNFPERFGPAGYSYNLSKYADFLRGDANGDGEINIADAIYLVNYLFTDGPAPDPLDAGDANCDGVVNIADAIYLVNYLFGDGPPPGCP